MLEGLKETQSISITKSYNKGRDTRLEKNKEMSDKPKSDISSSSTLEYRVDKDENLTKEGIQESDKTDKAHTCERISTKEFRTQNDQNTLEELESLVFKADTETNLDDSDDSERICISKEEPIIVRPFPSRHKNKVGVSVDSGIGFEPKEMWKLFNVSVDSGMRTQFSVKFRKGSIRQRRETAVYESSVFRALAKLLDKKKYDERKEKKLLECLSFEENYSNDLGKMINILDDMKRSKEDPAHPVPMPPELREGRDKCVLCNFHKMYDFHKTRMLVGIRKHLRQPLGLKDLFVENCPQMKEIYSKYVTEQIKISHIVRCNDKYFQQLEERARECDDNEAVLSALLLKPAVHITRYHLFFGDLAVISRDAGCQVLLLLFLGLLFPARSPPLPSPPARRRPKFTRIFGTCPAELGGRWTT